MNKPNVCVEHDVCARALSAAACHRSAWDKKDAEGRLNMVSHNKTVVRVLYYTNHRTPRLLLLLAQHLGLRLGHRRSLGM